jgi:hypothetical protein
MLHHLTGGAWGLVIRRHLEAATRTLPLLTLAFLPLAIGLRALYIWARPDVVAADPVLQAKQLYLNAPFFLGRAVFYFAVWNFLAYVINRWSLEQDAGGRQPIGSERKFRQLSAPGLMAYGLTITFASVDWVMSLEPEWFSTIFGLLTIAGYGLTGLAFTIIVLATIDSDRLAGSVLAPRHFHDLGKLLLAFTMLWAYLSFSQFLIIWSGNLPEEIPWYIARISGAWGAVAIALVVGHFFLPFTILLSAGIKKRSARLAKVAAFILLMRLVDLIWYVAPSFRHGAPLAPMHWMDLAIPVGLAAVWVFLFVRQLRARSLFPVNDPYFKEAFANEAAAH